MKNIKDLRIKIKVSFAMLLILGPVIIVLKTGDTSMYVLYWYCLSLPALFIPEKGYLGYLKIWFSFYFLGKWSKGMTKEQYEIFESRAEHLLKWDMAYYEQRLIKSILDKNGLLNLKRRYTGKNHNKLQLKGSHKFPGERAKDKYYSTYKRKKEKFL
jgi:hypothetical protein